MPFSLSYIVCSVLLCAIMLNVPTAARTKQIAQDFLKDLESFTYVDQASDTIHPIVCSICDGIPTQPQWSKWVPLETFQKLCKKCQLHRHHLEPSEQGDESIYPAPLLEQYKVNHESLEQFILSPKTMINSDDEVLVCKQCLKNMEIIAERPSRDRRPPPKAIANGRLTGDAPDVLKRLTRTELDLVSAGRIDCQSYVFFGGCHQQIRGWHTVFKNRPADNVSNLQMLAESGMKGTIVVVLCGPFTSTQRALVMEQCQVRPEYVIEAFNWLKENNYLYKDFIIPDIDNIPTPIIHHEQVQVTFHSNSIP